MLQRILFFRILLPSGWKTSKKYTTRHGVQPNHDGRMYYGSTRSLHPLAGPPRRQAERRCRRARPAHHRPAFRRLAGARGQARARH